MHYNVKTTIRELRGFLILWLTQSFSALGSSMTNFALVVWSYQQQGSALTTSILAICSYAPYVLLSIFAGALSDRWSKKMTMLASESMDSLWVVLFGTGKGAGAALLFFVIGVFGALSCLPFRLDRPIWDLETKK